ncbi:MAG: universal stress protein [Deltaproteobacteria bacterium]|nr:universal stress protein [Deltaproteobacteria bacterium]
MYTKLLVPVDGSPLSERILPYARFFARALGVPVELLHVIDPEVVSALCSPEVGRYFDTAAASMNRESVSYLETVARSFSGPARITCEVQIGRPAEIIVDRASATPGTLIAMATHGRAGVQRWLLGSVADKVLHATKDPLLLVRSRGHDNGDERAALKRIVVPLDGSALAEAVLPHARALAERMQLEVMLARVYTMAMYSYVVGAEGYVPDLETVREDIEGEEAKRYLEDKVEQLRWQGVKDVSYVLAEGNAAGEIIDLARGMPDNLIAM